MAIADHQMVMVLKERFAFRYRALFLVVRFCSSRAIRCTRP
jgi:hypothetical protein